MELPPQKKGPGFKTRPSSLLFYSETECLVTLSEGKFHQVRRMFSVLGNKVSDLQRTRLGPLTLPQNLKEGECVILERSQIIL